MTQVAQHSALTLPTCRRTFHVQLARDLLTGRLLTGGLIASALLAASLTGCESPPTALPGPEPLEATLLAPVNGTHFFQGQPVYLSARLVDPGSGALEDVSVTLRIDGRPVSTTVPQEDGTVTLELSTRALEPSAEHTLELTATRAGGPASAPATTLIFLDPNTPPDAMLLSPSPGTRLYADTPVEVRVQISDLESPFYDLEVRLALNGAPVSETPLTLQAGDTQEEGMASTWITLEQGDDQRLDVSIVDPFGGERRLEQLFEVGPANAAPDLCLISSPANNSWAIEGQALMLEGQTHDLEQSPESLYFAWYNGLSLIADGIPSSSGAIQTLLSGGLSVGAHTLRLVVTDSGGATCLNERQISVQAANHPPVIEILSPAPDTGGAIATELASFSLTLEARDDEDQDPLEVWLSHEGVQIDAALCHLIASGALSGGPFVSQFDCTLPAGALGDPGDKPRTVTIDANTRDREGASAVAPISLQILPCSIDEDGDGYPVCAEEGCDDDAQVFPGQDERCDGIDNDCDQQVDESAVDHSAYFRDADGDGFGDADDSRVACVLPAGYVFNALDCDDTNLRVYPDAPRSCEGIDADCDGIADVASELDHDHDGVALCYGDCDDWNAAVAPGIAERLDGWDNDCNGLNDDVQLESVAQLELSGTSSGQTAGAALAGLGDPNGDGFRDFAIGLPGAGRVYLYFGGGLRAEQQTASIDAQSATAWFVGTQEGAEVGAAISGAGDLNGDGIDDMAIGAPGSGTGAEGLATGRGATHLFFGCVATSGDTGVCAGGALAPTATFMGEAPDDRSGTTLAPAGDVNCDGIDDLLIGAPDLADGDQAGAGRVYLLFGRPDGWSGEQSLEGADVQFQSELAGARLGSSLSARPGDLDGDGCSDIVMGAPGSEGSGQVHVFFGREDWLELYTTDAADVTLTASPGSSAGSAVALSDLNDDGFDDLAIGAPDGGNEGAGQVAVVFGSGAWQSASRLDLEGTAATLITASRSLEQLGWSLSGGEDLDGDGCEDLAIGAPGWRRPDALETSGPGRVYLFYGSPYVLVGLLEADDADVSLHGGTPGHSDPDTDPKNGARAGEQLALLGAWYSRDDQTRGSELLIAAPLLDEDDQLADIGRVYVVSR